MSVLKERLDKLRELVQTSDLLVFVFSGSPAYVRFDICRVQTGKDSLSTASKPARRALQFSKR